MYIHARVHKVHSRAQLDESDILRLRLGRVCARAKVCACVCARAHLHEHLKYQDPAIELRVKKDERKSFTENSACHHKYLHENNALDTHTQEHRFLFCLR